MHHPYRNGYSVLPQLRKISVAEVFEYEERHAQRCLREKQLAMAARDVECEFELSEELRQAAVQFILKNYPAPLAKVESLDELAEQIQEDIILHAMTAERDWMAYGHVCLPSSWRPNEKIGKCLRELHAPIPGINLDNSRQLVETMVHHGPFERFIWSVVFDDRLNFHPDLPKSTFDPQSPSVFVKVERQVTMGFPEQGGALFLLCESLIDVNSIDRPRLVAAIQAMNTEELRYKGLAECKDDLLQWLSSF